MTTRKSWVIGLGASFALLLASQSKSYAATSAIYFDEKGNSHALDETLKNPFPANSKDEKALDIFLIELKKYNLCKIIYDGDTTSSAGDLEKKIDNDEQEAKTADKDKKKAVADAEKDFNQNKQKAEQDEKKELRQDEQNQEKELETAPKGQQDDIKKAHKENREKIKKKYRNDEKNGIIDELEKKKKAAIDAANATPPAPLKLTCGASDDCGDASSCKTMSLAKDPTKEAEAKEVAVPKTLNGISVTHIYFCSCGKKS